MSFRTFCVNSANSRHHYLDYGEKMKNGFDHEKYVTLQSEHILQKIKQFNNKLYLEFGGKLFDDMHAARVLPGFQPDAKIKLLQKLKDQTEIIVIINAADIERKKIRADFGITYDADVMRLIDNLRSLDIYVSAIVITQYKEQPSADIFKKRLEIRGERVFIHRCIKGYPNDTDTIVSDKGYGANEFVETTRPLVVVTAPGPGSGKLATCLSQLYHEYKRGVSAGYAKFETFPIWNLPLKHPVNIAYEAATADLHDVNMIDPYHMDAYGIATVNYNRDVEAFPVLKKILCKITGDCIYKSPTDMGVNMAGNSIVDDDICRKASKDEVIRRYFKAYCDYKNGACDKEVVHRIENLMQQLGIEPTDRACVNAARKKESICSSHAVAIQLSNGKTISGKAGPLLSAPAAAVINALKVLSETPKSVHLIDPTVLQTITNLKSSLGDKNTSLNIHEMLLALSFCKTQNKNIESILSKLPELSGCEAHSTKMLPASEETYFKKLNMNLTCDPEFATNDLFIQ